MTAILPEKNQSDKERAKAGVSPFLNTLFGPAIMFGASGKIIVAKGISSRNEKGEKQTKFKREYTILPSKIDKFDSQALQLVDTNAMNNLFIKPNLFDVCKIDKRNKMGIGGAKDVLTLDAIALDIDANKEGYAPRPKTHKFLQGLGMPPTIIVNSDDQDGGFHAYWVFAVPVQIRTEQERHAYLEMYKGFFHHVNQLAMEELGNGFDPTYGIERQLRLVATRRIRIDEQGNKTLGNYVTLQECHDDRYYSIMDFEQFAKFAVKNKPMKTVQTGELIKPVSADARCREVEEVLHALGVVGQKTEVASDSGSPGTRYTCPCPFEEDHSTPNADTDGSATIYDESDEIIYHCFHASCQGNKRQWFDCVKLAKGQGWSGTSYIEEKMRAKEEKEYEEILRGFDEFDVDIVNFPDVELGFPLRRASLYAKYMCRTVESVFDHLGYAWTKNTVEDETTYTWSGGSVVVRKDAEVECKGSKPWGYYVHLAVSQGYDAIPHIGENLGNTDLANAKRLVMLHGEKICYVNERWLVYDGRVWVADPKASLAKKLAGDISEILEHEDKNEDSEGAFQASCANAGRIRNMLELAQGMSLKSDNEFDRRHLLFNVQNGTVDLKTGTLLAHNRDDLLTQIAPVTFNPDATCPIWTRFVSEIFGGDEELIGYIQRLVGFSITGLTTEHIVPICYGKGLNGKTTFFDTIVEMIGVDYAVAINEGVAVKKNREEHSSQIYDLKNKRFGYLDETESSQRLNESQIKKISGSGQEKAKPNHKDFEQFERTCKVWMITNYKPDIRGTDNGIWRRIKLIPFVVQILPDKVDRDLPSKLRTEISGILNWAIQGCLDWQRNGLREPQMITDATAANRKESDFLGQFIDDNCVVDADKMVRAHDLWQVYKAGGGTLTQIKFNRLMVDRGFEKDKPKSGDFRDVVVINGLDLT